MGSVSDAGVTPPPDVTIVAHDVGAVGGMERQLAELVLGLRALGHDVTVIARTCELPRERGISFHRIRGPRRPFPLAYLWFMLAGTLAVRRRRRGVVHIVGAVVLNRVDVIAVHCCHEVYRPRSATLLGRPYVALVSLLKRLFERWCYRINRGGLFVCVSDGVAAEIRAHHPDAGSVMTIHNGVDAAAFVPGARLDAARALRSDLGIAQDRLVLAFVGGNWAHKRLGAIIEALGQAPGWDLVVAGSGSRRRYEELACSRGVAGSVHWLGVVQDIQTVYELADAFALPSSYETFSLVTFEAAASGLPILATRVHGVSELLEDRVNGLLIDQDPATIAARLRELAADPRLRAELGRAARASALEFGWGRMVAEHERLYRRVGASPPEQPGPAAAPLEGALTAPPSQRSSGFSAGPG
jgi:glycosyltransferase involved in cell wall biosynthesis